MSGETPKRVTRSKTSIDSDSRNELIFFNRYANRSRNPQDPNFIPEIPRENLNNSDDSNSSFKSTKSTNNAGDITIQAEDHDNTVDSNLESNITIEEFTPPEEEMAPVAGQGIKIRDAVEFVPMFDGHNIPINEFIEACNEAKNLIDAASEKGLVKLIRTRITGETRRTILNEVFETVANLTQHFKDLYDSGIQQLFGKLGYEIQRNSEGVIPFANRLREIGSRIFELKKKKMVPFLQKIKRKWRR